MMICPETFYEMRLKGKIPEQIMTVIRGLKREITRLKNIVEHPNYRVKQLVINPTEDMQLYMNREYLERAKQALVEAGGIYKPSAAEQKALDFDNSIPYINKIEFSIGGFFGGYETKTYTIDADKVHVDVEHSLIPKPSNIGDVEIEEIDKQEFLDALKDLHIGEWRKKYDTYRFNIAVMDGTQWHLEIYFSNGHRPVKIYGDNDEFIRRLKAYMEVPELTREMCMELIEFVTVDKCPGKYSKAPREIHIYYKLIDKQPIPEKKYTNNSTCEDC